MEYVVVCLKLTGEEESTPVFVGTLEECELFKAKAGLDCRIRVK
jgi:hypothetical protein